MKGSCPLRGSHACACEQPRPFLGPATLSVPLQDPGTHGPNLCPFRAGRLLCVVQVPHLRPMESLLRPSIGVHNPATHRKAGKVHCPLPGSPVHWHTLPPQTSAWSRQLEPWTLLAPATPSQHDKAVSFFLFFKQYLKIHYVAKWP